jgi:cobalt/nickel transport system permease protein
MAMAGWMDLGKMDELGRKDSRIHRIDARVKILVTLVYLGALMSFSRYEVSALIPFVVYPVALVAVGGLPAGYILRKVAIAAPFAIVIGIFNPVLDRSPVMILGGVEISGGWVSFLSLMVRYVLTVGTALALVACTGIHQLCAGLERLGVPRVFVVQVLFLYRYLFVVADEGLRMRRGVAMRAGDQRALDFGVYASLVGHLLVRSMDRAQRVYRSMLVRGFEGEIKVLRIQPFRWVDAIFLLVWILYFVVARCWNLADLLGFLVTGGGR